MYARLSGGGHICWQARNRKDVGTSDIEKAVDDFLNGKWAASAKRFVLCVRASLADTRLQDTIEAQAGRLLDEGTVFEGVDGIQLSEKLRSHPEIVDDFFGRNWLVAFAGADAAASLKRPLEVQRVIALRKRLAGIYEARGRHLDPGLNVDPARPDSRDIRKRFVVPNVDPANPFLVPSLEPDDWLTEATGQDDDSWQFDEYSDPRKPAHLGRTPSERSETPSVRFDECFLQGERALLLSGAPGSGIRAAQRVGLSLEEIRAVLDDLPAGRAPTREDWHKLAKRWKPWLDETDRRPGAPAGSAFVVYRLRMPVARQVRPLQPRRCGGQPGYRSALPSRRLPPGSTTPAVTLRRSPEGYPRAADGQRLAATHR